jgi:hypothetical protein
MLLWGLCNPKSRFTFASLTNNLKTIAMKIHTNFASGINVDELEDMARALRKAKKSDGHYIADKDELEWLSCLFGSVMGAIDRALEEEYNKE